MDNLFNFDQQAPQVPSKQELATAATQQDHPTFAEGFMAASSNDGLINNLIRYHQGEQFVPDPHFAPDDAKWAELTKGIPVEQHSSFLNATSEASAQFIRGNLLQRNANEAIAAQTPGAALAAGLTDPGMLLLGGAAMPFAASAKAGMMANAIRSGLVTGGTNVGASALLNSLQDKPYSVKDAAADMLFGFTIGAPFGALATHGEQQAARVIAGASLRGMVKDEAKAAGMVVTPEGEAAMAHPNKVNPQEAPQEPVVAFNDTQATPASPAPDEATTANPSDPILQQPQENSHVPPEAPPVAPEVPPEALASAPTHAVAKGDIAYFNGGIDGGEVVGIKGDVVRIKDSITGQIHSIPQDEMHSYESLGSSGAAATDMARVAEPLDRNYSGPAVDVPKSAMSYLRFRLPFTQKTISIPLRYDMRARLGSSDNSAARYLGSLLGADGVGLEGHAVMGQTAGELSMLHHLDFGTKFNRAWLDNYTNWIRENKYSMKDSLTGKVASDFDKEFGKALRGDTEASPHVQKLAAEVQGLQAKLLDLAKKHEVQGFDEVAHNPYYAMRMFDYAKMEELNTKFGTGQMEKLISGAIRRARPEWDAEKLDRVAKNYFQAIRTLARDKNLPKAGIFAKKDIGTLKETLGHHGIDSETTDAIADLMGFEKPEAGPARSKHRLPMDESYATKLKDQEGNLHDVGVADLFEKNGTVLFETYLRQMSGQIALAQVGIKSEGQFKRLMADMHNDGRGDVEAYSRYAQAMYDNIVGRPVFTDDFGRLTKAAKAIHDLNYIRIANQFGFAQIAELGNLMGPQYIRAFASGMPAMRDLLEMARGGKMTTQIAKDIEEALGFGGEFNLNRPAARAEEDMAEGTLGGKIGYTLDRAKRITSTASGLRSVNNMERGITSNIVIQKMANWATGHETVGANELKRIHYMGLGEQDFEAVMADMRKYVKSDDSQLIPGEKIRSMDYETWKAESPDVYDKFRFTVYREVSRIILEPDIGKTAYLMHHPLMKPMLQFRRFMLTAYHSQFLHGLHHAGWETSATFAATMFMGGIAYAAQTGVNYAHDPAELEKRLAPAEIGKAAFNRAGMSSVFPMLADSGRAMLGYDPMFQNSRTSMQPSGAIVGNPSVDFINKMWNTGATAGGMAVGNRTPTQNDFMQAWQMLPFSNAVGIRTLGGVLSQNFPKSDPNELPTH